MYGSIAMVACIACLLLIPGVIAQSNCTGSTLTYVVNHTFQNTTHLATISHTETLHCPAGCADNGIECDSPENVPVEFYTMGSIGLFILAMMFGYLGTQVKDNGEFGAVYQLLFLFSSLITAIAGVGLLMGFSLYGQTTAVNVVSTTFLNVGMVLVVVFTITFLKLLYDAVKVIQSKKKGK